MKWIAAGVAVGAMTAAFFMLTLVLMMTAGYYSQVFFEWILGVK